jgi:hypothetical protein
MKDRIQALLQKIAQTIHTLYTKIAAKAPGAHKAADGEKGKEEKPAKLTRQELLEVLVKQSKKIDSLEAQLKEANEKLAQRELTIANAGSLAEAALKLNQIFEDADAACQQYRDSLKAMAERQGREEDAP